MPNEGQHLAQATRNEAAADALASSDLNEWAVTALFYAALHLSEDARYRCRRFAAGELRSPREHDYEPLKQHVFQLLATQ